jgi:ABC-type molybdate transport system substrate-binding protein
VRTICFWLFFTAGLIASANAHELFVSAAASLTDALKEIDARFEKRTGTKIVLNLGASSMLARQIEEGAPADVFLAVVEAGNADAAFVYKTDALSSSKVRVALQIPAELAPKIVYPMAILANSAHRVDAGRFLEFLKSDEAVQVFEKLGFGIAK